MGQTLSSPATKKHTNSGENGRFAYAVSEMQGWRISMEDAHAALLDLDEGKEASNTFFAVYDGHGGGTVAKYAGQNVHKRLVEEETYKQGQYEASLKRAFLGVDEDLLANPAHTRDPSGCTAVAALMTTDGKIYVANAGDSRSVLSVKGEVKWLSQDHKPTADGERDRIQKAGGYIEYGRVNGNLALSRALGDFEFKKNYSLSPEKQIITADPEITIHDMTDEDEFVVIACDGIWDCLNSQQAVDFIRRQVAEGKELSEICENICEHCLAPDTSSGAGIGCDNMTVMIVAILNGRTKDEWHQWIKDRVDSNYGYNTPIAPPQLYAHSRLVSFRARREAMEEKRRQHEAEADSPASLTGSFKRVLASNGGVTLLSGSGISSDDDNLMFTGHDDDDDDSDSDEDDPSGRSYFSETLGLAGPGSSDPTKGIKAQLAEFEQSIREESVEEYDHNDEDNPDADGNSDSKGTAGETKNPPLTASLPNGDVSSPSVEQLKSQPHGDEPLPVVKAEGLLDVSEDPLLKA